MNFYFFQYYKKTFRLIVYSVLTILFIRSFIIEPGKVNGRSMENTFQDNNIFFMNKFVLLFTMPKRGQVVQVIEPNSRMVMIKRIIALPGETITIKQNSVFITGIDGIEKILSESYLKPGTITISPTKKATSYGPLSNHYYFVMGDNRSESKDSRNFGPIDRSHINGLVIF